MPSSRVNESDNHFYGSVADIAKLARRDRMKGPDTGIDIS